VSDTPANPTHSPRSLTSLPVAPHGHQIQAAHQTVLPPEDPGALARLAEVLAPSDAAPGADLTVKLSELCARYPSFLDGWARLAEAWYSAGEPVQAYACARVGYHRGLDRLRKHGWGGTGQVHWSAPTNRGFLRSLYLLMAAAIEIGEDDEATRCRAFLLDLDPDDGIGAGAPTRGERVKPSELP